jgi:hypothetical protein
VHKPMKLSKKSDGTCSFAHTFINTRIVLSLVNEPIPGQMQQFLESKHISMAVLPDIAQHARHSYDLLHS